VLTADIDAFDGSLEVDPPDDRRSPRPSDELSIPSFVFFRDKPLRPEMLPLVLRESVMTIFDSGLLLLRKVFGLGGGSRFFGDGFFKISSQVCNNSPLNISVLWSMNN
jgi:hypothetical protein